jgi:hypothetical protein
MSISDEHQWWASVMSISDEHQWWASVILWCVCFFLWTSRIIVSLACTKFKNEITCSAISDKKQIHTKTLVISINDEHQWWASMMSISDEHQWWASVMRITFPLRCVLFLWTRRFILDLFLRNSKIEKQDRLFPKIEKQVWVCQTRKNTHTKKLVMSISDEHQWWASVMSISAEHQCWASHILWCVCVFLWTSRFIFSLVSQKLEIVWWVSMRYYHIPWPSRGIVPWGVWGKFLWMRWVLWLCLWR